MSENPPKLRTETSHSSESISVTESKAVLRKHPEFERTYDMMLGIRTVVGNVYARESTELTLDDFHTTERYRFPAEGSKETPAHKMRNFKFKDYCPQVFRKLRERFGIEAAEYLLTVTNFHYLEFISNSKSGQFFFYTHDRRFMIKTMSKPESKTLRIILPHYFAYVMTNANTFLTRFYGIHRVKPKKKQKTRFLIMGSVFYTDKYIHETYDLKGSTQGRKATDKEKTQEVPMLKDIDILESGMKIKIGKKNAELLMEQIRKDTENRIMDYSLLLGIHYIDRPTPAGELPDIREEKTPHSPDELDSALNSSFSRRQSHYGLRYEHNVLASPASSKRFNTIDEEDFKGKLADSFNADRSPSDSSDRAVSLFQQASGGIRGVNDDGSPSNAIYFMGIIDILQVYNPKKSLEHFFKSFKYNAATISSVNPKTYAKRFNEFIEKIVE